MYNTCLWTVTVRTKNKIDATHRKLLRKVLNIKWPKRISNEKLMNTTQQKLWSENIQKQRIRWLGHALRLPEDTPCKQAMEEYVRPVTRPRGHPVTTCNTHVINELKEKGVYVDNLEGLSCDRTGWRSIVAKFD